MKNNEEIKSLIKDTKFYLQQFKKINIVILIIFIFDLFIFSGIVIGFAFQLCGDKISKITSNYLSYMVVIFSFYILIKFTITNFFYNNSYFFKTVVYKKSLTILNITIVKDEIITSTPYWFLSLLIFTNVFSTIVINFQIGAIFNDNDIIAACISTLSTILLIPSFAAILNKITEVKKPIINSYINLIKNQFVTFKDLFTTVEFENNCNLLNLII